MGAEILEEQTSPGSSTAPLASGVQIRIFPQGC